MRPDAHQDTNNNSDDCRETDDVERRDFVDQDPPSPTCHETGDLGPMQKSLFLCDVPDWINGIEDDLLKALDDLPVPAQGPTPDGINIHDAIQVSSVNKAAPLSQAMI
jgi:hypothetical protein